MSETLFQVVLRGPTQRSQKEQHWNNEVNVSERPRSNAYVPKHGHTQAPPPEGPS
jgi:hypothetical protein